MLTGINQRLSAITQNSIVSGSEMLHPVQSLAEAPGLNPWV
jgi:hypothetical protein